MNLSRNDFKLNRWTATRVSNRVAARVGVLDIVPVKSISSTSRFERLDCAEGK